MPRSYIQKDSTINIYFTQRDLDKFYTNFIKNGLDTLPKDYEPKCEIRTFPASFNHIRIVYNNNVFKIIYSYDVQCEDKDELKKWWQVDHFVEDLWKIIRDKKEYKNLKKIDLIFM